MGPTTVSGGDEGPAPLDAGVGAKRRWRFYRAIELDPDFAEASFLGLYCLQPPQVGNGWRTPRASARRAFASRRGVELRPDDSLTIGAAGLALAFLMARWPPASSSSTVRWHSIRTIRRPVARQRLGSRCYNSDHDLAIDHVGHAERLSPLDPQWSQFQLAKCMAQYLCRPIRGGRRARAHGLAAPPRSRASLHPFCAQCCHGRICSTRLAPRGASPTAQSKLSLNANAQLSVDATARRQAAAEGSRLAGMPGSDLAIKRETKHHVQIGVVAAIKTAEGSATST